jgi:hypothetical protein
MPDTKPRLIRAKGKDTVSAELAAICTCCAGCAHLEAVDSNGDRVEGQYAPCSTCGAPITGRPRKQ